MEEMTWKEKIKAFFVNIWATIKTQFTLKNFINWGAHIVGGGIQGFLMTFYHMGSFFGPFAVVSTTAIAIEIDQFLHHDNREPKLLDRTLDIISWLIGCGLGMFAALLLR